MEAAPRMDSYEKLEFPRQSLTRSRPSIVSGTQRGGQLAKFLGEGRWLLGFLKGETGVGDGGGKFIGLDEWRAAKVENGRAREPLPGLQIKWRGC